MTDTDHKPVELELYANGCGLGICDHPAEQCPVARVCVACDACTFDDVDLGLVESVIPVPWPCEQARRNLLYVVPGGQR